MKSQKIKKSVQITQKLLTKKTSDIQAALLHMYNNDPKYLQKQVKPSVSLMMNMAAAFAGSNSTLSIENKDTIGKTEMKEGRDGPGREQDEDLMNMLNAPLSELDEDVDVQEVKPGGEEPTVADLLMKVYNIDKIQQWKTDKKFHHFSLIFIRNCFLPKPTLYRKQILVTNFMKDFKVARRNIKGITSFKKPLENFGKTKLGVT